MDDLNFEESLLDCAPAPIIDDLCVLVLERAQKLLMFSGLAPASVKWAIDAKGVLCHFASVEAHKFSLHGAIARATCDVMSELSTTMAEELAVYGSKAYANWMSDHKNSTEDALMLLRRSEKALKNRTARREVVKDTRRRRDQATIHLN